MAVLIDESGLRFGDRLDLIRGAVDAHLHPPRPSPIPVVAALSAGALATSHAVALASQPAPLDWPGYLLDALPLVLASVGLIVPVLIGLWLRLGDADGVFGRLGIVMALAGHGAWLVAIAAALARMEYGPLTAVAATVAMIGTALLGVALAGSGAAVLGGLVVVAALAGVAPPAFGWPVFGLAWSAVGFRLLLDYRRRMDGPAGPIPA